MKLTIFLLLVYVVVVVFPSDEGLYSPADEVFILTSDNFTDIVYNKRKTSTWFIQFYNAWCGHCRRFAPNFRKLAKDVKEWSSVISLGVVACSSQINTKLCRTHDISAYPTLKLFPPFSSKDSTDIENALPAEPAELRYVMAEFINRTKPEHTPSTWPKLKPLKSIEEIWEEAKSDHKHILLIFEDPDSVLGIQLIMDFLNKKNILIRRLLKETVVKYGITKIPSLYLVNKDGTYNRIASSTGGNTETNRAIFRTAIQNLLNNNLQTKNSETFVINKKDEQVLKNKESAETLGAGDGPSDRKTEEDKIKEIEKPQVYLQDLESALHYSFRQEIAIRKEISGDNLKALKDFLSVLSKYLPGRDEVKKFLQQVYDWSETITTPISGGSWVSSIDNLQDELAYLPERIEWIGCKGSEPHYRGYPCSMWTLFHTLTVNAYLSDKVDDVKEVLNAIKGYMQYFFGCAECSTNFLQMAKSIDQEIKQKKDMVIWLWSAHNKANKRLHGDLSEDPEYPKIQFPSPDACPKCSAGDSKPWNPTWRKKEVLNFLVEMYRSDNIVKTFLKGLDDRQSLGYRAGVDTPTENKPLDWWEKKQRNQDLKKLYDIRSQKRDKFIAKAVEYFKNESFQKRQIKEKTIHSQPVRTSWSLSSVDLGMCMAFYVICAIIVLMLYYHFTVRTKHKPICRFLPI